MNFVGQVVGHGLPGLRLKLRRGECRDEQGNKFMIYQRVMLITNGDVHERTR